MKRKIFEKKYYGLDGLADIATDVGRALFHESVSEPSDESEGVVTVTIIYEDEE